MLDEIINYVQSLQRQVEVRQRESVPLSDLVVFLNSALHMHHAQSNVIKSSFG